METKISVMIVDDSLIFRTLLRETLSGEAGIEVVSQAVNGKLALPRIRHYRPDVLVLDQEMPEMDGLQTLEEVRRDFPEIQVIMFSAHTVLGARVTIRALSLGAFDFVTKPGPGDDPVRRIKEELIPLILSLKRTRETAVVDAAAVFKKTRPQREGRPGSCAVAAIGISTGGPAALHRLLPRFPQTLAGALLIVQHMPPIFTRQLAASLDAVTPLRVVEAEHEMEVERGSVYIAPGGKHMELAPGGDLGRIRITDEPPEQNCRPSVNVLFRSVSAVFPGEAVGVIMTGMGDDGLLGMRLMRERGCYLLAQEKSSCLIYGMPSGPVEQGLVNETLSIEGLAQRITGLVGEA